MTKRQKRAANKKIHLMTLTEVCYKLEYLRRSRKGGTTYAYNLWSHYHNLTGHYYG